MLIFANIYEKNVLLLTSPSCVFRHVLIASLSVDQHQLPIGQTSENSLSDWTGYFLMYNECDEEARHVTMKRSTTVISWWVDKETLNVIWGNLVWLLCCLAWSGYQGSDVSSVVVSFFIVSVSFDGTTWVLTEVLIEIFTEDTPTTTPKATKLCLYWLM